MQRFRACRGRLAAAALLPLLGACGSSHSASPSPTTVASPGTKPFEAQGFITTIPPGWTDHTADQQAVDAAGASGSLQMLLIAPTNGAVSNEHIDVTTVAQPVPDDQLASYLESVAQNGATSVSTPQPFTIGGATGLFVTYNLASKATPPAEAVPLKVQDMLVNHGGQTYEIVLNTAQADFDTHLQALQEVLQSWHWKG